MMNPDEPLIHLDTLDDLPSDVPPLTVRVVGHGEDERLWIFDGFKWKAESSGRPGEVLTHSTQRPEDTGFKHCPKCVGTRVLTSIPPQVVYECDECDGGNEFMEMALPLGSPGPAIDAHDSILLEANRLINGEREQHYGHPHENFSNIAAMWSAYLDRPVSHFDVVNLMIMLKLARTKRNGYHRDSYTDVAGYAGCAERIHAREVGPDENGFYTEG